MAHECMTAEVSYAETDFDDWPVAKGKRAHLGQIPLACSFCGAAITALSDYGWYDFSEDEPEFLHCCWRCKRPIHLDSEGEV